MEGRIEGAVNNRFYDELGERWYKAKDDPIALLRAESRSRVKWIVGKIKNAFADQPVRVLDVGCGAGFLSNELSREGFALTGLDSSDRSLAVARLHDTTGAVEYELGDASNLPYPYCTFEVACAMDFLEHVDEPLEIIREITRVLKPGGLFFFHTFNRNLLSYLIVIKGVEWFVKNTPHNMHVLKFFIKPSELRAMCNESGLTVAELRGFGPRVGQGAFWRMLCTGVVEDDLEFEFKRSKLTGYTGLAVKR